LLQVIRLNKINNILKVGNAIKALHEMLCDVNLQSLEYSVEHQEEKCAITTQL
jgi:hypothetical protein